MFVPCITLLFIFLLPNGFIYRTWCFCLSLDELIFPTLGTIVSYCEGFFCRCMFSFLLVIYSAQKLLGHVITVLNFGDCQYIITSAITR